MNQIGKIIFASALGFVSGAALATFFTYRFMYNTVEEKGMAYYEEEVAKARAKIAEVNAKQNETKSENSSEEKKPDVKVENDISNGADDAERDVTNVRSGSKSSVTDYNRYFKSYCPDKKDEKPNIISSDVATNSRNSKPMFVDDYDSLVAVVPRGEEQIYEWTFYSNFKGGIVVDIQTEMVMNYERLFEMSPAELLKEFGCGDTLYIYLPGDSMGVVLGLDPKVSPELLELYIPPTMYPSPSEDDYANEFDSEDFDDDEEDDDEPDWGD